MANPVRYGGFKPTPLLRSRHYWHIASDTVAIYIGDVTSAVDDGTVKAADAGVECCPGCSLDHVAASTGKLFALADMVEQEYICQDDGAGTPALSQIHNNADHVATAGNTTSKVSGHTLALTGPGTATATFRIIAALGYGIDNPEFTLDDYGIWRVRVNETMYSIADNAGI